MSKPIFADTTFYKPAVTEGDYRSENSHLLQQKYNHKNYAQNYSTSKHVTTTGRITHQSDTCRYHTS